MTHRTFEETQKFNQIWLWILLIGVSVVIIIQVPLDLIKSSSDAPMSTHSIIILLVSLLFVIGLNALFFFLKLKTKVNSDGISITFAPFINKPIAFKWSEIETAFVRKYQPIWEYGGWGIRFGMKGRAYNTAGNMGLQLIMRSGKRVLIGTQKPEELEAYLKKYIFTGREIKQQ